MRLGNLKIKGFKSFADETLIRFDKSVLGIVGPNGAGKSNIIDAIKWVLGEGSTNALRLESMQDVLFNGTKSRKQGTVARVTLTFEDTKNILHADFNQISISRFLYRNGQSEYRLNDVQCRKKDITSLFLDSGLGNNSYSIITLGMVEDILHDNNNSRSRMIEEASGINKYKIRKKETIQKLANTQLDLDRIEDLLYELNKSSHEFEKQAKRAHKFKEFRKQYQDVNLTYAHKNLKSISQSLNSLKKGLFKEEEADTIMTKKITELEAGLQKKKKDIISSEQLLSTQQKLGQELNDSINELEIKKTRLVSDLKYLKSSNEDRDKQLSQLKLGTSELKNRLESLSTKENKEKSALIDLDNLRNQYTIEFEKEKNLYDQLRADLMIIQGDKEASTKKINETTALIESSKYRLSFLTNQLNQLAQDSISLNTEINQLSEQYQDIENKFLNQEKILISATKELNQYTDQSRELQANNEKIKNKLSQLKAKKFEFVNQRKIILELIENYEGYSNTIKFLNEKEQLKYDMLTDIISVKHEEYREVVEFFFKPYVQHVITNNVDEALSINRLVTEAQKGRIQILIKNAHLDNQKNVVPNNCIPLISAITYHEDYDQILQYLCANTYIFLSNLEELKSLDVDPKDTFLLPKNQLIFKKGEIHGGSPTLFEKSIFNRKKKLKSIEDFLHEVEDKLNALSKEHDTIISTLSKLHKTVDLKTDEINKAKDHNNSCKNQLDSLKYQIEAKKDLFQNQNATILQYKGDSAQIQKEINKYEELMIALRADRPVGRNEGELSEAFKIQHEKFEHSRSKKEEIDQQVLLISQAIEILKIDLNRLRNEISAKTKQFEELLSSKDKDVVKAGRLDIEIKNIDQQILAKYESQKNKTQELDNEEQAYFQSKSEIIELENKIHELRSKRDKLREIINKQKDSIVEKEQQMTSWVNRADIEYQVNLNDYIPNEDLNSLSIEQLETKKESLNQKIKLFGEVNPMAIEAYEEINLRIDKITGERDDILNAKANLEATIEDIDQTAMTLFNEAVNKIKLHFKEVFQSLFSDGDDCDIVIINPKNPIDSHIELIAKPKGKRPKSISQLSGGEKTLTAIAFLFGLYLVKPSPFCIFDEVDAPLDDANTQKFIKIIHKFSKNSQFIIVTHNKATMAEMEILYGVFMKELGVSGVTAVDFSQFKDSKLLAELSN